MMKDITLSEIIKQLQIEFPNLSNIEFSHYDEPANRKRIFTATDENDTKINILVSNIDVDDVYYVYFSPFEAEEYEQKTVFSI